MVLKGVRRLQFNIELRNMEMVPQLEKVSTGLFPLLWIEEVSTYVNLTVCLMFGKYTRNDAGSTASQALENFDINLVSVSVAQCV